MSESELVNSVYDHLRAIARHQLSHERPGHTLTATALVHEAYLRLDGAAGEGGGEPNRILFLHAASEAMRRILIEHARARGRVKRGGGAARVSLDAIGDVADLAMVDREGGEAIIAFDESFKSLESHNREVADVVRLRFFAGQSIGQIASTLGISDRTVNNRWSYARTWLAREMQRAWREDDAGGME